jgi:hypothetical protein
MGITRLAANYASDKFFGAVDFTPPAVWYLALSTGHVNSAGSGLIEPSASGSYIRHPIPNNKSNWTVSSSGSLANLNLIQFDTSASAWGTVLDVALLDGSGSAANVWFYQAFPSGRIIQDNVLFEFEAGTLQFSVSGSPL